MFNTERDMVLPCVRWLVERGYIVAEEFKLPWGICDIVAAKFSRGAIAHKSKLGQPKFLQSRSQALLLGLIISEPGIEADTLDLMFQDHRCVFREEDLLGLVRRELVEVNSRTRTVWPTDAAARLSTESEIIAIELKLYRWSEVIFQADRHRPFAHLTYIAVPWTPQLGDHLKKYKDEMRDRGVGLIAVKNDSCRVVLASSKHSSDIGERICVSERLLRFQRA
jgi:hypothetical protein